MLRLMRDHATSWIIKILLGEIEFSVLKRQGLKHRVGSIEELEQQVSEWYRERNRNLKSVDWQLSALVPIIPFFGILTVDNCKIMPIR